MAKNNLKLDRSKYSVKNYISIDKESETIIEDALRLALENPTGEFQNDQKKINSRLTSIEKTTKDIKLNTDDIKKILVKEFKNIRDSIDTGSFNSGGSNSGSGSLAGDALQGVGAASVFKSVAGKLGPAALLASLTYVANQALLKSGIEPSEAQEMSMGKALHDKVWGLFGSKSPLSKNLKGGNIFAKNKRHSKIPNSVLPNTNIASSYSKINPFYLGLTPTEMAMLSMPDRLSGKNVYYGAYGSGFNNMSGSNNSGMMPTGSGGSNSGPRSRTSSEPGTSSKDGAGNIIDTAVLSGGSINTSKLSSSQIQALRSAGVVSQGPQGGALGPGLLPGQVPNMPKSDVSKSASMKERLDYIKQAAIARGIDPNIPLRIAQSEGLHGHGDNRAGDWSTTRGEYSSFGDFQLHYGGGHRDGMSNKGLGDLFTKETGLDARDPSTWKQQTDFALNIMAKKGNSSDWHGDPNERFSNAKAMPVTPYEKHLTDVASDNTNLTPKVDYSKNSSTIQPAPTQTISTTNHVDEQQANIAPIRKQPIQSKLKNVLDYAAKQAGVDRVEIFSGGQDSTGPNRTGSHRHDNGGAADVKLYKDGKLISDTDPAGRQIMANFITASRHAGATGIGFGESYMGPSGIHVGYGKEAIWGSGVSRPNDHSILAGYQSKVPAPDWAKEAFAKGQELAKTSPMDVNTASASDVIPAQTTVTPAISKGAPTQSAEVGSLDSPHNSQTTRHPDSKSGPINLRPLSTPGAQQEHKGFVKQSDMFQQLAKDSVKDSPLDMDTHKNDALYDKMFAARVAKTKAENLIQTPAQSPELIASNIQESYTDLKTDMENVKAVLKSNVTDNSLVNRAMATPIANGSDTMKNPQKDITPPRDLLSPSARAVEKRMKPQTPEHSYGDDNAKFTGGGPR